MEIPVTHAGDRTYHSFTVSSNGLRGCVISDTNADKAAGAIAVAAGQLHDDAVAPGIAHLTEHMLFMGSSQYPSENEYSQYLQQNGGGHSNAYTDLEMTVYYLDVACGALSGALDRLAWAVTEPLVRTSSLSRELQAVDSEHSKNMAQDHWRLHQLTRTLWAKKNDGSSTTSDAPGDSSPHPFGNFGTGNQESLLRATTKTTATTQEEQYEQLRQQIMTYFQQHYTADNMTVCVMGNQSVEELQTMVEEIFAKIPAGNTNKDSSSSDSLLQQDQQPKSPSTRPTTIPPLPPLATTQVVQWIPLRSSGGGTQLELQWLINTDIPLYEQYQCKPSRVWSHLLGHEGPGTLLSEWRRRQWAHDLFADDASTMCRSFALFVLHIELTPEGRQHITELLDMLYYYIETVLQVPLPDWVGEELRLTSDTNFRFLAKRDAAQTCSSLVVNMHHYRDHPEHYLSGAYKVYTYDRDAVAAVGQCLQRDKPVLMFLGEEEADEDETAEEDVAKDEVNNSHAPPSPQQSEWQTDPWYGTRYRVLTKAEDETNGNNSDAWRQLFTMEEEERPQAANGSEKEKAAAAAALVANLALPDRNDMLPSDFGLVSEQATFRDGALHPQFALQHDASPRCALDTDTCRLWVKVDSNYSTPKVNLLALLRYPGAGTTPEAAVLAALWVEVVTELCNEFSYAASMAGLHCGFQDTVKGMELQLSGYNHKAGILLERLCDTIRHQLPLVLQQQQQESDGKDDNDYKSDAFFERMRHKLEQHYQEALVAQPYQHGSMAVDLVLEGTSQKGFLQQRLAYLTNRELLTSQVLLQFSNQMLASFRLEVLVHGNVWPAQAQEWTQMILDRFRPVPPARLPLARAVQLPTSAAVCYRLASWNTHDENSCVVNVYQVGIVDIPTNATLSVLLQLLQEPAFNVLRTEEQLGYIVFTSLKTSAENVKSIMFLVQSDSFDPLHVNDRIEQFLIRVRSEIATMPDEEFQSNVDAVCESLLERPKNLSQESSQFWNVITNQTYRFHRLSEIAAAARTQTKTDILRLFDRYLLQTSPHRRKLSVQVFGTAHASQWQELQQQPTAAAVAATTSGADTNNDDHEHVVFIQNPDEFAGSMPLFPGQQAASIHNIMLQE